MVIHTVGPIQIREFNTKMKTHKKTNRTFPQMMTSERFIKVNTILLDSVYTTVCLEPDEWKASTHYKFHITNLLSFFKQCCVTRNHPKFNVGPIINGTNVVPRPWSVFHSFV